MTKEIEVKDVMNAFEEFKTTNDKRLVDLEKKGSTDPLVEAKLAKLEIDLAKHEDANQKVTLAAQDARKANEDLAKLREQMDRIEAKAGRPGAGTADVDAKAAKAAEYKNAFDSFLRKDESYLSAEERKALVEFKTLFAGNDTLGGYYLAPPEMATDIIKQVVLQSPVRSIARVTTIGVQSYKLPKRTGTFAATRVGEIGPRSETTGYTTGIAEINAPEMFAEVHISTQMIEDQFFDIEAEMSLEFSEQFAVKEGAEFVNGTGVNNQAEGFLTSTALATTNFSGSAGTIADVNGQADGLISMFYNGLKTAYAKNATWVLNRQTLGSVRKLKDANKQYIWQPGYGVAGALPSTILGTPYVEMPDMPNEGAGNYPIAVGDFYKGYRIIDRALMSVLRDPYTIASTGQILYRARKRVGGAVVLGEAIAKLQCHV
jgi:HK97 family phage major capsid protein